MDTSIEHTKSWKAALITTTRLVRLVWQHNKVLFTISVFTAIVPSIIPFINAYIYKLIIDIVVSVIAGNQLVPTTLYLLVAARIGTFLIQTLSFLSQEYASNLLWAKMPIALNELVLGKISHLDVQHFENSNFTDLLERVRESYTFRPQNLITNFLYTLQSIVQLVVAFIAIVQLNWVLTGIILLFAIPEFINQNKLSQLSWAIWGWNSPLQKRFWYLANLLQDARSIKEMKIYKLAKRFLNDIREIYTKFYNDNKKLADRSFVLNLGSNILGVFAYIGIEIFIVMEALARRVTIGDISFYTTIVNNFQTSTGGLFRNLNSVYDNSMYVASMFEVLDTQPIITDRAPSHKLNIQKVPRIEFKNVDFTYPDTSEKILNGFSITIQPGEKVAFVGENGAGKSTIIKLLTRLYDVQKGEICLDGVNIQEIAVEDIHRHIGILFQDFNKYEYTVQENILFGDIEKKALSEDIQNAAQLAGADTMIHGLKKNYKQMLGRTFEDGVELSQGQWQKVALSRAFYRDAPILILDEPTASLDAKAEAEIFERVHSLSKGKTVIIVSHRFSTVRQADTIYVINKGKIIESGNHETLMKLNKEYASLFHIQAQGYK